MMSNLYDKVHSALDVVEIPLIIACALRLQIKVMLLYYTHFLLYFSVIIKLQSRFPRRVPRGLNIEIGCGISLIFIQFFLRKSNLEYASS